MPQSPEGAKVSLIGLNRFLFFLRLSGSTFGGCALPREKEISKWKRAVLIFYELLLSALMSLYMSSQSQSAIDSLGTPNQSKGLVFGVIVFSTIAFSALLAYVKYMT